MDVVVAHCAWVVAVEQLRIWRSLGIRNPKVSHQVLAIDEAGDLQYLGNPVLPLVSEQIHSSALHLFEFALALGAPCIEIVCQILQMDTLARLLAVFHAHNEKRQMAVICLAHELWQRQVRKVVLAHLVGRNHSLSIVLGHQ